MNDILFGNNNGAVVKRLAKKRMNAGRSRNVFAVLAIILTTVLFATFFSVCGGFLDQAKQIEQLQFGTAHASVKYLSAQQYAALEHSDLKKEISYTRLVGTAINSELSKLPTEVRYTEEMSARSFVCYPTTGNLPQNENELATSTLVLDALGVPHELNAVIHLSISVDGAYYDKDFVLSGYWDGYNLAAAQEAWISRSYADAIAPEAVQPYSQTGKYAGLYCADINFAHSRNIEEQLTALCNDAGLDAGQPNSVNPVYHSVLSQGKVDFTVILAVIALLGTILLTGYLIIYNLFYISVTQDVHFFGLLRTIGASGRQLKGIVRKQALCLAMIGLPFGLLIGYGIGRLLMPFVLTQTNVTDTGIYHINPLVLLFAALFSLLTTYISSIRPCRYAAKIPAIEAVRYSGDHSGIKAASKKTRKATPLSMAIQNLKRSRKKAVLVILSLTLSLVLLNITYTAINGFDLQGYIKQYAVADFYVTDFSVRNYGYGDKNLAGISDNFLAEMNELPGLENSANIYAKDIHYTVSNELVSRFQDRFVGNPSVATEQFISSQSTTAVIYGIEPSIKDKVTLTAGEWNDEKWLSGEYAIVDDFFYSGMMEGGGGSPLYQIGDSIVLTDEAGNEHAYTVMGVGHLNYNLDAQYSSDLGLTIILPAQSYGALYGDTQPLCTIFNVDDPNTENAENWISDYCTTVENNLTYISHRVYEQEFESDKATYSVVGGILTVILAMIGLLNFVNAIATSILSRQTELAMLGAIGMSRKQTKLMLIYESLAYIAFAVLLTATFGTGMCYLVCTNLISNVWAFVYHFTLTPVALCMPFLVMIAVAVPLAFNRGINKRSIVERLREVQ